MVFLISAVLLFRRQWRNDNSETEVFSEPETDTAVLETEETEDNIKETESIEEKAGTEGDSEESTAAEVLTLEKAATLYTESGEWEAVSETQTPEEIQTEKEIVITVSEQQTGSEAEALVDTTVSINEFSKDAAAVLVPCQADYDLDAGNGNLESMESSILENTVYGDGSSYSEVSLENKIDYIREWYYATQDSMDDLSPSYSEDGNVTAYYDGEECVRITVNIGYFDFSECPGADRLISEYYYHNGLLYFVFLHYYDEEYRYYLEYQEGDICCIRYIDQTGSIWDYYEKTLLRDLEAETSALCNAGSEKNFRDKFIPAKQ